MQGNYMQVGDVAKALGVSRSTVIRLVERGYLTATRNEINQFRFFPYADKEIPRVKALIEGKRAEIQKLRDLVEE